MWVQFISYYIQEFKARRAAVRRKKPLMIPSCLAAEAEERSLENLTGSLPPMTGESPATPDLAPAAPLMWPPIWNRKEAARRNAAQANPADQAAA